MDVFVSFWQHFPEHIEPIAFSIYFIAVRWYALFFLGGFFLAFLFARFLARKEQGFFLSEHLFDLFIAIFIGALIGGKVGYIILYNFPLFLSSPSLFLSPYDFDRHIWTGFAGMSYHGGLIGGISMIYLFSKKYKISFLNITDFMVLSLPIALFFGRLGNFLNGELYGRTTEKVWGMFFPGVLPVHILRHPSSLYEAFFEGIVIFFILFFVRKKMPFVGALSALYLALYAVIRFFLEYFREPDFQIGLLINGYFSLGQILSFIMLLCAIFLFFWLRQKKYAMIQKVN